jgi:HlyD family secretion protein
MNISRLLSRPLWRRIGLGLLGALLLAALAYVAMRTGPLAATRVTVTQASQGSFSPSLFGVGTVEARYTYLIGPTSAGRVRSVAVDVGDRVKAGQLLAEMDPVDLAQRVTAIDASMARARSAIDAAQAQRSDALARQQLAAINARRYVELGDQNFISPGAVEVKLQEQSSAEAATSGAEANLTAARHELRRLEAERAAQGQQLDNLRLLAPVDGLVISREAEMGSTVVAGQAVLRLIEPASLWVRLRLDQGRSAGLAAGLPASIALRSAPGAPLAGKVARVEATSDSVTEERVALVSFDALPQGLSTGELAEVTLTLPRTAPALLLPNASIRHVGDQPGVWRVEGDGLRFAPVRIGQASLDGQVQILEGLGAGDAVVVYSERELAPGRRIKIVESLAGARP